MTAPAKATRERLIVLDAADGKINTGVWPSWGGEDPAEADLMWGGAGVHVHKPCQLPCRVTQSQDGIKDKADAVIIETINYPQFGLSTPVQWPSDRGLRNAATGKPPLSAVFYYEPKGRWGGYNLETPSVAEHADITIYPSQNADVPIALMCPWGQQPPNDMTRDVYGPLAAPYLREVPPKLPKRDIAFFNDRGIDSKAMAGVAKLMASLKQHDISVDVYSGSMKNADLPGDAKQALADLPTRLRLIGTYKLVIVAQSFLQDDWIEPELSHALVAGAVPVVWGPTNLRRWLPDTQAALDGTQLSDEALLRRVRRLLSDDREYAKAHAWREAGRKAAHDHIAGFDKTAAVAAAHESFSAFSERVNECVHYAECRVCQKVLELTGE